MSAYATVHASAAIVGGSGVLIRGASGSGKSSLLLSLLDRDESAKLVADDRVHLRVENGRLIASVPETIAGKMEIRGVGIVSRPYAARAAIDLVVDLVPLADSPRLPDERQAHVTLEGFSLRRIFVAVGAPDAAARVRAALTQQRL